MTQLMVQLLKHVENVDPDKELIELLARDVHEQFEKNASGDEIEPTELAVPEVEILASLKEEIKSIVRNATMELTERIGSLPSIASDNRSLDELVEIMPRRIITLLHSPNKKQRYSIAAWIGRELAAFQLDLTPQLLSIADLPTTNKARSLRDVLDNHTPPAHFVDMLIYFLGQSMEESGPLLGDVRVVDAARRSPSDAPGP